MKLKSIEIIHQIVVGNYVVLATYNYFTLDEKYRFSKTETLLKLYGNLELKFPV